MAEKPISNKTDGIKEAVCIETQNIYDACRDKECLADIRVFLNSYGQELVDRGAYFKPRDAEVLWVFIGVEPVPFNKGHFTVDIQYFFKVTFDVPSNICRTTVVEGLCGYSKRVMLYGSEGNARIFSSDDIPTPADLCLNAKNNLPLATVELVDPVILSSKVVCMGESTTPFADLDLCSVPSTILELFTEPLVNCAENKLLVTLGLFSIIRLSRTVQLLIPSYDFCIPDKCSDCGNIEDPCEVFKHFPFPLEEFFPPLNNSEQDREK